MPSIAELQSIATMEAMASGRPVIAADAMALPHLVHDGDNGYLFPPDDVEALADRLRRILVADEAELQRLSENSLHLIKAHDIQTTLTIFENLYQGLGEASPTSDDNAPDYESPIGRLSENLRDLLASWREDALGLQSKAEELRQEAVEKLSNVRDDAIEKWSEVKEEVKEQVSEIKDEVTEAAKRLRKKKE
jgi:gas vesicle protein